MKVPLHINTNIWTYQFGINPVVPLHKLNPVVLFIQ